MPLSEAQTDLHWSMRVGWGAVCQTNAWRIRDHRLFPEAHKADFSQWHAKVWAFAELIARQNHRAVTPDDLRKGTYMFALGTPKSLTKFDNGDLDRVLILFRLLVEPDDLKAVKDWIAYERFDQAKAEIARCKRQGVSCNVTLPDDPGERRRHLFFVSKYPDAVIRHFVVDRFQGVQPEDMPLRDLRQLTTTLKNRRDYSNREAKPRPNIAEPAPQLQEVDEPF